MDPQFEVQTFRNKQFGCFEQNRRTFPGVEIAEIAEDRL
jgi:hypothetical protein